MWALISDASQRRKYCIAEIPFSVSSSSTFSCGLSVDKLQYAILLRFSLPILFLLFPFSISTNIPISSFHHSIHLFPTLLSLYVLILNSSNWLLMASPEIADWVFDYGVIEDIPLPGGDLPSLDLPDFTLPSCDFTASFRFLLFLISLTLCIWDCVLLLFFFFLKWMGFSFTLCFGQEIHLSALFPFLVFSYMKDIIWVLLVEVNYMLEHGSRFCGLICLAYGFKF